MWNGGSQRLPGSTGPASVGNSVLGGRSANGLNGPHSGYGMMGRPYAEGSAVFPSQGSNQQSMTGMHGAPLLTPSSIAAGRAGELRRTASPVRNMDGVQALPAGGLSQGYFASTNDSGHRRATSPLRNPDAAYFQPTDASRLSGGNSLAQSSNVRSSLGAVQPRLPDALPTHASSHFSGTSHGRSLREDVGALQSRDHVGDRLSQRLDAGTAASPSSRDISFRPGAKPPFYWVPTVDTITEFEVSGEAGEVVSKHSDYEDPASALPIAGTLKMARGGLYVWTLQIVRQSPHRPNLQFGVHGYNHAKPWRLVSTGRCSRSRDDGPWLARPGGDVFIGEGDYLHCELDLRGLDSPFGSFAFAVNDGPFETVFEDIPLSEGPLQPIVAMGGGGTTCRVCST